jgi:hypothetical protein
MTENEIDILRQALENHPLERRIAERLITENRELLQAKQQLDELHKLGIDRLFTVHKAHAGLREHLLDQGLALKNQQNLLINKILFWRRIKYQFFIDKVLEALDKK